MPWPTEVQVAVIGAAAAALGYVGKSVVEWGQAKRKEHASTIAQLQQLDSLLKAAHALYIIQQAQAKRLMADLRANHPQEYLGSKGYDKTMERCYDVMSKKERELHRIIRAYTEHSLRKVNQAMSDWCGADEVFKTGLAPSSRKRELADRLFALEIHLMLWHAKYESWIPNHDKHALVYLNDEEKHGLGFPKRKVRKDKGGEALKVPGKGEEVSHGLEEKEPGKGEEVSHALE